MTPSKETVEVPSPAAKTAAPAAQAKPDLNKMRADAVSLDVPVRVHGSRVTEVVRGVTPHTEPFEEEASTMIVFPHGGVVRMVTVVSVGQMLVLTNLRTNQDAICRAVKVRAYSNSQAYVEVEFTHRQPGYWGVHFPTDDDESMLGAPTAPQPAVEPEKKPLVVSSVTVKVEPMPKLPTAPPRSESAFAQIGSQEEVQPSATHTELRARAMPAPAPMAPPLRASAPSAAVRSAASREMVDEEPLVSEREAESEAPHGSRTFGTLTGGTGRAAAAESASDFGARLDTGVSAQPRVAAPRGGNWMWAAACAFFLVAGLAGGALYFRQHPTATPQQAAQTPLSSQPAQQGAAPSAQPAMQDVSQPVANTSPVVDSAQPVTERPSRPQPETRLASNTSNREARSAALAAPAPATKSFVASDARPVARAIESSRITAAPTVVGAPTTSADLPEVLSSSDAALPPPPQPQPLNRVRVGGVIVQPKLMHSVAPNYPTAARQAGLYGNVVINAQVDKAGNVASMKVISGPATLQGAAMTALKLWKYQPATLDGVAIATDITVTIKFQQQ
jgi:protein TonB